MWIYKITNKITGKMYIGQTICDVQTRWNQHCMPSNSKKNAITAAIKTYGRDSFNFEVIDTALSIEELNKKEIEYISKNYKSIQLGNFSNEVDAHKAYLSKYKETHGYIPESLNPLKLEV